jgi:hypothetical protein
MNLTHLFTTARVVRATYQIISTTILLYYIATRGRKKRRTRLDYYEDR